MQIRAKVKIDGRGQRDRYHSRSAKGTLTGPRFDCRDSGRPDQISREAARRVRASHGRLPAELRRSLFAVPLYRDCPGPPAYPPFEQGHTGQVSPEQICRVCPGASRQELRIVRVGYRVELKRPNLAFVVADRFDISEVEAMDLGVRSGRRGPAGERAVLELDEPYGQGVTGIPVDLDAENRSEVAQREAARVEPSRLGLIAELVDQECERMLAQPGGFPYLLRRHEPGQSRKWTLLYPAVASDSIW